MYHIGDRENTGEIFIDKENGSLREVNHKQYSFLQASNTAFFPQTKATNAPCHFRFPGAGQWEAWGGGAGILRSSDWLDPLRVVDRLCRF